MGWEDPLEKEMATHFIILAWEISQTEELAWRATAHGVSQTQLSMYAYILCKSTWTEAEISSLPKITGTASGIRIQKQSQFSNN